MTNAEKYKEEIREITKQYPTARFYYSVSNEIKSCDYKLCPSCIFNKGVDCLNNIYKWLIEEYQEIDWNKVPIDTKILVSNTGNIWSKRHFAKFINGEIYAFSNGCSSWSTDSGDTVKWKYVKLAEGNE